MRIGEEKDGLEVTLPVHECMRHHFDLLRRVVEHQQGVDEHEVLVGQIQIGGRGNVNLNSPFAILSAVGIMTIFASLFVCVAFVANVVIRDDETGFAPILRATPVAARASRSC